MKIAYLVSEYPAISHTFIFREIQILKQKGVEVFPFSINRTVHLEKMTKAEQEEAANTIYIKSAPFSKILRATFGCLLRRPGSFFKAGMSAIRLNFKGTCSLRKSIGYFAEALLLIYEMQKRELTHVHVHFANPAATVAMIASFSGELVFSLSVHGPDVFDNVRDNLLKEKVQKAVFIRCISYYCKSQLMRLVDYSIWEKLYVVHCGIDTNHFFPKVKKEEVKAIEILCLGRLSPAKGQHILLKALGLLLEEVKDVHLSLVGGGTAEASLKELAKELNLGRHVEFVGPIGQSKLNEYYDKADIFVLPSFAEGVPVVLMEAMAKEVPVVSTYVMGIPELVENGKSGLLVLPGDTKMLFDKIKELIQKPELRKELGQKGRQQVLLHYDLVKNTESLLNIFNYYMS